MYQCTKIFNRTELRIGISKAKNCQESFAEVHFCMAPQKPDNNAEKPNSNFRKIEKQKFGVEKLNDGDRLTRVLPKFQGRAVLV